MDVLATLIIGYIDYKDMMSFLLAFLSSKDGVIPEYRMFQVKYSFLKTYKANDGKYQYYPNGIVEGRYVCVYNGVHHEGVFINGKRYVMTSDANVIKEVREDDEEHLDYDLSCRDKPFGLYMDKHTGHINTLICGAVYGDINMIVGDDTLMMGSYIAGRTSRITEITDDGFVVTEYTPEGRACCVYEYDVDGDIDNIYRYDEAGRQHGICITTLENKYMVISFNHGRRMRVELHSFDTRDEQTATITCKHSLSGILMNTYEYIVEEGQYVDANDYVLEEDAYISRAQINNILSSNDIDPKFISARSILKSLHK
jgi:hypothetical protein